MNNDQKKKVELPREEEDFIEEIQSILPKDDSKYSFFYDVEDNNISRIYLHSRTMKHLPDSLGNLSSLKILELGSNRLQIVPETISNLTSLTYLVLNWNGLKELPSWIGKLKSLTRFHLSHNKLELLPDSLGDLKNLEILHLNNNNLKKLPESIGNLSSLKELRLEYNLLTTLPNSIGNLCRIETLYLNNNILANLPTSIGNMKNLKEIYLKYNNIDQLPESITNLSNLTNLRLNNNHLKKLPETMTRLNSLRNLDLSFNYIENLPKSLCDMASLRELKLFENNIKELPQNLANFKKLRVLDLRLNSLVNLPESIGYIKPLKSLQLSCNSLINLPKSVINLKYMKDLNVSGNRITHLDPEVIEFFEKIEKKKNLPEILNLKDNPITKKQLKLEKESVLQKIDYYIELTIPQSWKVKLRRILDIYGLSNHQDKIFDAIRYRFPMIKHYVKDDNSIDVGLSKLGGNPDVPENFEWPYWNKRPLSFLMQFNLKDLRNFKENPFPTQSGLLYFFYDPLQDDWGAEFAKNEGAWRVLYYNDDKSELVRIKNPSEKREYTYPTCLVTFYKDIHLPCFLLSGKEIEPYTPDFFNDSPLEFDFRLDRYGRFRSDFFEHDNHALFGYPDEIQELGKMNGWCQLLQLCEDEMLIWVWGHGPHGRIHFMIREDDLRSNNYDNVHLIMDCY